MFYLSEATGVIDSDQASQTRPTQAITAMVTPTPWPEPHEYDMAEKPWDRQKGEPTKAYAGFRLYRDTPAHQRNLVAIAGQVDMSERRVRTWAQTWQWRERTAAWDDACHQVEDRERLEAIRAMHSVHRRAGRAALSKAVQALNSLQPETMPPSTIARLLELGAKLERSTLIVSVEELQGIEAVEDEADDPWERIAAELTPPIADDLIAE